MRQTSPIPPPPVTAAGGIAPSPPSTVRRSGASARIPQTPITTQATSVNNPQALSRFRFGDELGRGGMGVVREAEDVSLRRRLAIKLLQTQNATGDEVAQFIEEAQITAQLGHPNIVPVHELGTDAQGRPWLAMKKIEGVALDDRIADWKRRNRPLRTEDINEILSLFSKVCDALAFAHSRRVIHRDIKPANIMVGSYGEVLLVDWGLARPMDATDGTVSQVRSTRRETDSQMTMDGDVFGTPAFMPPEQARGDVDQMDERTDIFSLGGVLYNMLTLEVPYQGEVSVHQTLAMAAQGKLIPPRRRAPHRAIPKELEAIVLKAMAADSRERYRNVNAFKDDLDAWQSLRPTSAYRAGPIERIVKLMRRNPTRSLAAVMLVMVSLIVVMLLQQLAASQARTNAERLERQAAEARANQEKAERESAEAAAAIAQAEAAKAEAEKQAAEERARAQEYFAELGRLAPERVTTERDQVILNFMTSLARARNSGMSARRFIINMAEATLRKYHDAYIRFERVAAASDEINMTAEDYYNRGILKWGLRTWDGAIQDFTKALELDPHYREAVHWRGSTQLDKGLWQEAIKDMEILIEWDEHDQAAWSTLGHCYLVGQNLDRAYSCFLQAYTINNNTVSVLVDLGSVQLQRGNYENAETFISRAIALEPNNTQALGTRGSIRQHRGDLQGAIRDYNGVLAINPTFPEVIHNRGLCYQGLNDFERALEDFNRAIELSPNSSLFYRNRGVLHWRAFDDPGRAMDDFNVGLQRDGRIWQTRLMRAQLHAEQGNVEDAVKDCDVILEDHPQNWLAWRQRAVATQTTDRNATIYALQQAITFCPDANEKQRLSGLLEQYQRGG